MYGKVIWATDGLGTAEGALRETVGLTVPGGPIVAVQADGRVNGRQAAGAGQRRGCGPKWRTP